MSWLYSRALVEAYLEGNYSDGEPSAQSKTTPMPQAYLWPDKTTGVWNRFPSGMMYEPLTEDLGKDVLMSYLADSPARTSAQPGVEPESEVIDPAYGQRWPASWAKYDPDTCSWKTLPSSPQGELEQCWETFPRWGIMRDGEFWGRDTLEPRIKETVSGSWPTPTARDYKGARKPKTIAKKKRNPETNSLPDAVEHRKKMWPTPKASDSQMGMTANCSDRPPEKSTHLQAQVALAENWKPGGGQLNPTWVELLMGWPENWTSVEGISHVLYCQWLIENCNDEETRVREVLRVLWCGHVAEEVSRAAGRPVGIREAAVLLANLCQHANRPDQARVLMACAETLEADVRGVRPPAQVAGASHQPGYPRQSTGEHPDVLQELSRLLAHYGKAAWQDGSWENAAPRVIHKVASRVDRLRAIGNGQVPAVVKLAWETI